MTRTELAAKGGQATSAKKKRAARRNARKPRPGRSLFNEAVRFVAERIRGSFDREPALLQQIRDKYHFDVLRAENVLAAAKKRL